MTFKTKHPLYGIWNGIKCRCYTKTHKYYSYYGGRGIYVCDRWRYDFHAFASDMGDRPHNTSIDRIDNSGPYSPENCRWATNEEQQRNKRCNRYVEIDSKKYLAIELAEIANVKIDTIVERAKKGLSFDEVISKERFWNLTGLSIGGIANGERQKAKRFCKNGHEFTPENTGRQKSGRRCRTCHKEKEARRRLALKEASL